MSCAVNYPENISQTKELKKQSAKKQKEKKLRGKKEVKKQRGKKEMRRKSKIGSETHTEAIVCP